GGLAGLGLGGSEALRAMTCEVTFQAATRASILLGLGLSIAACGSSTSNEVATWRADCPSLARPAPLSLDAAREAERLAARRHERALAEAAEPGHVLREMACALGAKRVAGGEVCLGELAGLGQLLFEHEYNFRDGLGGGDAARSPTGPFRRVHAGGCGGPETISCPSCHWVGGPNGAGAETDTVFLEGDGERTASGDQRNAPALVGLGVVQALAAEMSRDLQKERADLVHEAARAGAAREAWLTTKGVDFGVLRVTAKGEVDASGIRGVDEDLVVKPFGWKGTRETFTGCAAEALQIHMGIQSDVLLASATRDVVGDGKDPADPDDDGVRDELGRGPFAALTAHLALLEMPIVEPLIQDRQLP